MAKEKVDMARQQALEQENILLKNKLAEAEKAQAIILPLGDNLSNEMKKIRQKGKSTANTITVVEKNDHVNISLWTKWGKQIGPLHPDNAIQTLNRFADIGIMLTVDRPTSAQLEAWGNSSEGKAFYKKQEEIRARKTKSKRSGQMDRLSLEIAKMSGMTLEAINKILPAGEVGKK